MTSKADKLIRDCIWNQGRALSSIDEACQLTDLLNSAHKAGQDLWCLVGCGTSYHAGVVAQDLARSLGIGTMIALSSPEFVSYYPDTLVRRTTLVALTQSGDSVSTLNAIRSFFDRGGKIAAVCTAYPEKITRRAGLYIFSLNCADEIVGPKTKGFALSLALLYELILALLEAEENIRRIEPFDNAEDEPVIRGTQLTRKGMFAALKHIGDSILNDLRANDEYLRKVASDFADCNLVVVTSAGIGRGLALEVALKIIEMAKLPAIGIEAEEAFHGLSNALDEHTGFVLLAGDEPSILGMTLVGQMAAEIGSKSILSLSSRPFGTSLPCCNYTSPSTSVLYPFAVMPLAQWFCYNLALARGQTPTSARYPKLRGLIKRNES